MRWGDGRRGRLQDRLSLAPEPNETGPHLQTGRSEQNDQHISKHTASFVAKTDDERDYRWCDAEVNDRGAIDFNRLE
ncbi:MAG: hypothetical protein R3C02_04060 [Planctomycetaceae bacterium]